MSRRKRSRRSRLAALLLILTVGLAACGQEAMDIAPLVEQAATATIASATAIAPQPASAAPAATVPASPTAAPAPPMVVTTPTPARATPTVAPTAAPVSPTLVPTAIVARGTIPDRAIVGNGLWTGDFRLGENPCNLSVPQTQPFSFLLNEYQPTDGIISDGERVRVVAFYNDQRTTIAETILDWPLLIFQYQAEGGKIATVEMRFTSPSNSESTWEFLYPANDTGTRCSVRYRYP